MQYRLGHNGAPSSLHHIRLHRVFFHPSPVSREPLHVVGSSTPVPGAARGYSFGCSFAHLSTGACHGYTPAGCMGGCSSTWLPGWRLHNTMTASVHSLCADSLGHHSQPPVTRSDINQSKFSPRWKWAAPGWEGAPDNSWDADGEEIQGAAEAFSQPSGFTRCFLKERGALGCS